MEYRIEKEPAYRMTGLNLEVSTIDGKNLIEIPRFWDAVMNDGRYESLRQKADEQSSTLGVCGVCREFNMTTGDFIYSIAIHSPDISAGLPDGCEDFEIPASNWAKFISRGPLRPNFQETIKRIYEEWFPSSGKEHAGTAEIEFYPPLPDTNAEDYWCEYWVPLK